MLHRPDGAAHSAAVNELITTVLPTMVNFDATNIFLEGVSTCAFNAPNSLTVALRSAAAVFCSVVSDRYRSVRRKD